MAVRELFYGQSGSVIYNDTEVATDWYPVPYNTLPLRGALVSQIYVEDVPVNAIEVVRRMDVDGTPGNFLKAGATGLPVDAPLQDLTTYLFTSLPIVCGEICLTPKVSSSGPEGTLFYDSDDDHVWVATE